MAAPVSYNTGYSSPWYSGSPVAASSVVPGTFMVAINGRPFMLNTSPEAISSYGDFFKEESLPLLRQQADQSKNPAEASISPAQFWRRGQETWHKGAGQGVLDREDSDQARYSTSKGLDPWTRYTLGMHKAVTTLRASANTNLYMVAVTNGYIAADGQELYAGTAMAGAPTLVTGTPAAAVTGLATHGGIVYAGFGASGIYTVSGGAATSYVTGTVNRVGYAKGRLLTGFNGGLYNPIAAGALPAVIWTQPDTGWSWKCFAEGDAVIYAAGDTGSVSRIYRTAVVPDGTALGIPVVAATLPTNEIVQSMLGYMGFVIIGTDKGVRFATATASGDLTLGALIPTPGAVNALEALGQFVWFGWTNYDTVSSGLGRLDLTTINEGLAPAFASDLMATAQGAVAGIVSVAGRHGFSVAGAGFYGESATVHVSSGTLTTGVITFGIADPKVHAKIDLKHSPLPAGCSVAVAAAHDRGTGATLGSSATLGAVSPSASISVGKRRSEEVELTFTLFSATTSAPVLTRWTLMSYPAPPGASMYVLPLLLHRTLRTLRDTEVSINPYQEYSALVGLHENREIVSCQVGEHAFEGVLEDFVWLPEVADFDRSFWSGTMIIKVRKISG